MSVPERLYEVVVHGLRVVSPLLGRGDSKLARGVRGRRRAAERMAEWGRRRRDPDRPLAWFHAPSVGEGLQARAVLEALADAVPEGRELQSVFTHFSPSAESLADAMPVALADYLPWDVGSELGLVLDALRPDLVVFTKTEVWPVLTRETRARGIPTVLVAATLPPSSSRLRWPARPMLRRPLGRLTAVLAIAPEDAERFVALGARRDRVEVTGDPGIDSAARRAAGADPEASYLRPFRDDPRPTLVAGSTWPPDEEVLVDACTRVRTEHPELRLVVAPHEPTEAHLRPLEAALRERGWGVRRLADVEAEGLGAGSAEGRVSQRPVDEGPADDVDAVVVDRVGVLAHLYTVGRMAYVGGGFHDAGLHSVLEPAAAGLPVTFGSGHRGSRAAVDLLGKGGAVEVDGARELARTLGSWLADADARARTAEAARGYIEEHLGAAERTAARLLELL